MSPPKMGEVICYGSRRFEVSAVWPILTPYRRAGQITRIEGWGVGLRELPHLPTFTEALTESGLSLADLLGSDGSPEDS